MVGALKAQLNKEGSKSTKNILKAMLKLYTKLSDVQNKQLIYQVLALPMFQALIRSDKATVLAGSRRKFLAGEVDLRN